MTVGTVKLAHVAAVSVWCLLAITATAAAGNRQSVPSDYVYLPNPVVEWSEDLSMPTNAFGRGNAAAISPDGTHLYVTTLAGILLVREVGQPSSAVYQFKPPDRTTNGQTTCTSGVAFHAIKNQTDAFLVYAVRDDPAALGSTKFETTSRIVAINHPYRPGDSPRWISPPVPGIVSGSPVISHDGKYVFFTHNSVHWSGTGLLAYGRFTAIEVQSNAVPRVVFTGDTNLTSPGPYAPLAIAHQPEEGNFRGGGQRNTNDVLVWGKLQTEGSDFAAARTYAFQVPLYDIPSGWTVRTLFSSSWSVSTRPAISRSGMNLYYAISRSQARGWRGDGDGGGRAFHQAPSWKQTGLSRDESNKFVKTFPSYGGVALSPDEDTLFLPSTTTVAYAMNSSDGTVLWQSDVGSVSVTEPRVSPDGKVVYFQGGDGSIVSKSAETGSTNWVFRSDLIDGKAEFSISPDGTVVYLAGNSVFPRGIVYVLRVIAAETVSPTERPTVSPTGRRTAGPTVSPTTFPPTRSPTEPTRAPTLPGGPTLAPTAEPTPWWTYEPTQEPELQFVASLGTSGGMERFGGHWGLFIVASISSAFVVGLI